jgi:SAM-dependent methyltransferase
MMQTANRIVRAVGNRWQRWQNANFYRRLSVGEAFSTIYRSHAWGSRDDRPFCSGEGSIREEAVGPYCAMIQAFLEAHHIERLVDLGCGDFSVASRLLRPGIHYTGIDVVPDLIRYNQQNFGSSCVEFRCLNILDDELPSGDLCLVRQVLQHLYRHAIVTEHVYSGDGLRRNLDKPQGPGTRIPKRSGVFLESSPFNCSAKILLEIPLAQNEVLRSVLVSFTQ